MTPWRWLPKIVAICPIFLLSFCLAYQIGFALEVNGVGVEDQDSFVEGVAEIPTELNDLSEAQARAAFDEAFQNAGFVGPANRDARVAMTNHIFNSHDFIGIGKTFSMVFFDQNDCNKTVLKVSISLVPASHDVIDAGSRGDFGDQTDDVIRAHEAAHRATDRRAVETQPFRDSVSGVLSSFERRDQIVGVEQIAVEELHKITGHDAGGTKSKVDDGTIKDPTSEAELRTLGETAGTNARATFNRENGIRAASVRSQSNSDHGSMPVQRQCGPPPATGGNFDRNNNGTIEDAEFFEALDAWIGNQISDSQFFEIVDDWIGDSGSGSPTPPPTSHPPASSNPIPENLRLGCFVERLEHPCDNIQLPIPEAQIGLAFMNDFEWPAGSSIEIRVSSFVNGIELIDGKVTAPYTGRVGQLGTGLLYSINIPVESRNAMGMLMAQFFYLGFGQAMGLIDVSVSIVLPDGTRKELSNSLQLNSRPGSSAAVVSNRESLSVRHLQSPIAFRVDQVGSNNAQLQLDVFGINGSLIFTSTEVMGRSMIWRYQNRFGQPVSNGTYFYRLSTKNPDGTMLSSELRRIVIIR